MSAMSAMMKRGVCDLISNVYHYCWHWSWRIRFLNPYAFYRYCVLYYYLPFGFLSNSVGPLKNKTILLHPYALDIEKFNFVKTLVIDWSYLYFLISLLYVGIIYMAFVSASKCTLWIISIKTLVYTVCTKKECNIFQDLYRVFILILFWIGHVM